MSDKDINIHVRADGVQQTEQEINGLARQHLEFQQLLADGNKKSAEGTDKTSQSLLSMDKILGGLKSGIAGFVGAWLGLEGIRRVVDWLIGRLERIRQLQDEVYKKGVDAAKIGQSLEFQTGTAGKQTAYAKMVADIQAAGAISSPDVAYQMASSAHANWRKEGGIDNPKNVAIPKEIAPMFGASGVGQEQVAAFFDIADKSKTPATAEAYKTLFAKFKAAADVSKTTVDKLLPNFLDATSGYLARGGSVDKALSTYSSIRSVTADDSAAAFIFDQATKLSGGEFDKQRKVIERKMGVRWKDLNQDQQLDALIGYIQSLPEGQAQEELAKKGFSTRSRVSLLATPEAKSAFQEAQSQINSANPAAIDKLSQEYVKSMVGVPETQKAKQTATDIIVAKQESKWQQRMTDAASVMKERNRTGEDNPFFSDKWETQDTALISLVNDIEAFRKSTPKGSKQYKDATSLLREIRFTSYLPQPGERLRTPSDESDWSNRFADLQEQVTTEQNQRAFTPQEDSQILQDSFINPIKFQQRPMGTVINNNNQTIFYPSIGAIEYERFTQD